MLKDLYVIYHKRNPSFRVIRKKLACIFLMKRYLIGRALSNFGQCSGWCNGHNGIGHILCSIAFNNFHVWPFFQVVFRTCNFRNLDTISCKIFETNSSFHVGQRTTDFFASATKNLFCQGGWALGYHFMKFKHFPNIS